MATAIGNYQPSLVLTETIATEGVFPVRAENGSNAGMTIGMFHTYGFNFGMDGAPIAAGQVVSISQNTAFFSIVGNFYGGNGQTTFALPDLRGRTAVGEGQGPGLDPAQLGEKLGGPATLFAQQQMPQSLGGASAPVDEDQPGLAIKYLIRTEGVFPSESSGGSLGMIGSVVKFAGNFVPGGYMECNGQLLNIAEHDALFSLIGTTYGGDGQTTFALPDLRGRTVVGAGGSYALAQAFGQEDVTIGPANLPASIGGADQPIDNREPSLALNYIIALQGIFPSRDSAPDSTTPFLGEIIAFAGNFAPRGFAFCNGQLLSINQNQALFALLGTQYGGNGQTTFALPDLRGRAILNQGDAFAVGNVVGSEFATLTLDNIPDLAYSGSSAGETHFGGNGNDIISGLGGTDTINGQGGNDTLVGNDDVFASVPDTLAGGDGDDTIYAEVSDVVQGGAGRDVVLVVNAHPFSINLGATSIEYIISDFGNDTIDGSTQAVGFEAYADGGNDIITGSAFNDFIFAGSGDDVVTGGDGDDVIVADVGIDNISGGNGDDRLYADSGDTFDGGAGSDVLYISGGTGLSVDLAARSIEFAIDITGGDDTLDGSNSTADLDIYAGAGTDTVTGASGMDFLWGGAGDDTIAGNGGDDTLVGEAGIDTLTGGAGTDNLFGNGGSGGDGVLDTFVFTDGWGTDFVFDFDNDIDRFDLGAVTGVNGFGDLTVTATPQGHAHIRFGANLISVANAAGLIDAGDFII